MTKRKTIMISICAVLLCICSLFTFLPINNCGVVKANTVASSNDGDMTFFSYSNGINMLSGTSSVSSNLFKPYNVSNSSMMRIDADGTIHLKGSLKSDGDGSDQQLAIPAYDNNDSNIIIPANTAFTFSAYNYTGTGCRLMTFAGINMSTNELVRDVIYIYGQDITGSSSHKTMTYNYDLKIVYFMFYYYIPSSTEPTTITFDFSIKLSLYLGSNVIDHYVPYSNSAITNHSFDLLFYNQNSVPFVDVQTHDEFYFLLSDTYPSYKLYGGLNYSVNLSSNYFQNRILSGPVLNGPKFAYSVAVKSSNDAILQNKFEKVVIDNSDSGASFIYNNFGNQSIIQSNATKYSSGKFNYIVYTCANGSMIGFIFYANELVIPRTYYSTASFDLKYIDGYNDGYDAGYDKGNNDGYSEGNNDGYDRGYKLGNTVGYNSGYSAGVASSSDYSFMSLISATIDAPIKYFQSLFNFDLLGVNLQSFITALFTLAVIITIIKLVL